ncbi:MAG TPA: ferredoxin [Amycolatopsis sp.]|uniref:ferredoxin n=1 Tax=Amycolatopsis sp. TaxID=37632 RepID=UPI002B487588|nr:ferredoxin [Amycolatopsis sp.]HKS45182.1 ferredoxin [Amycolatopsis sp.]
MSLLRVSVDNHRCHRYAFCQAEAPENFKVTEDGRLDYERRPRTPDTDRVLMAARSCPMQAIHVEMR